MGRIIDRRRVMGGKSLPYDAEIEFLESSGTQYINSLYYPNNDTRIEAKGMYTHQGAFDNANHMHYLFGVRQTINGTLYQCDYLWNYYSRQDNACVFGPAAAEYYVKNLRNEILEIVNDKTGGYINSIKRFYKRGELPQLTIPMFLLWCNVDGVGQSNKPPYGRMYYCKIYENNILVRDFIPVRVGQTGYMYDKVSGQLFGNAGTGDFILGPDK